MHNRFKAWSERAPHSLAASLCRARTRPPLRHDKFCGTEKFLPHPSQSVGEFKVKMSYQRRILSWNNSLDNSMMLSQWGIAVRHAPFFIALQRRFSPAPSSRSFHLVSTAFSENYQCFHLPDLAIHMHPLCSI